MEENKSIESSPDFAFVFPQFSCPEPYSIHTKKPQGASRPADVWLSNEAEVFQWEDQKRGQSLACSFHLRQALISIYIIVVTENAYCQSVPWLVEPNLGYTGDFSNFKSVLPTDVGTVGKCFVVSTKL